MRKQIHVYISPTTPKAIGKLCWRSHTHTHTQKYPHTPQHDRPSRYVAFLSGFCELTCKFSADSSLAPDPHTCCIFCLSLARWWWHARGFDNSYFLFGGWCRELAHWQLGRGRKSFQDGVFLCVKSSWVCWKELLCKPFLQYFSPGCTERTVMRSGLSLLLLMFALTQEDIHYNYGAGKSPWSHVYVCGRLRAKLTDTHSEGPNVRALCGWVSSVGERAVSDRERVRKGSVDFHISQCRRQDLGLHVSLSLFFLTLCVAFSFRRSRVSLRRGVCCDCMDTNHLRR